MAKAEYFFHGLSPGLLERLALLNEECAEVQQIISKIIRHGIESYNPLESDSDINQTLLEKELGHVQNAVRMLVEACDISQISIDRSAAKKRETIQRWLHHQPKQEQNEKTP